MRCSVERSVRGPARRGQPVRRREELGEDLLRGQHRPEPLDRRVEAEVRAQVVAQLAAQLRRHARRRHRFDLREVAEPAEERGELGRVRQVLVELLDALRDEQAAERVAERRPCRVVRQTGRPGAPPGFRRRRAVDLDGDVVELDRDRRPGQLLPVGDGAAQDVQHRQAALRGGHLVRIDGGGDDALREPAGGGEHHRRLAQRREHAPDVPDERGAGPHDQHAAAGQPLAVGVEEVGDAVQRHGGLPSPGAALDHDDTGERQPDDRVLLGLDRRHDVAHRRSARRLQRGEQCRIGRGSGIGVLVQHIVVEIGDPLVGRRSGELEMPSPGHPERRGQRRAVERPGGGCPPVDQRALPVRRIGEPDAADVARRRVGVIEPAEAQPRAGGGQRVHPLRPAVHGHVALPAGTELPARRRGQHAARLGRGRRELGGEQRVQPADPRGLRVQLLPEGGSVHALPAHAILKLRSKRISL